MEIKSISFNIKGYKDSIVVDYNDALTLSVLETITRILDIEGYKTPLVIEADYELWRDVKELLCNEHWLIDFDNKDPLVLFINLNGFKLIFKQTNKN